MLRLIKPGTNFDFIGRSSLWVRISVAVTVVSLIILGLKGPNFGLDFTGGHEILVDFARKETTVGEVRAKVEALQLGETAVQEYQVTGKTQYLVRVQRTSTFTPEEVAQIEAGFKQKYGEYVKRVRYNPDAGDVVELEMTETASIAKIDTSSAAIGLVVTGAKHEVRQIRQIGRPDQPRFSIVLKGIDDTVMRALQDLDPGATPVRVEFVGPTVGEQLRNDGIKALLFALIAMLIYIALRFDFFYSPGAVLCLFHNTVITVAVLSAIGEEFSLTTIAALLTLIGYSLNDTIVIFDRIRETVGKAQGQAMKEVVNRAVNETLSRTVLTASAVFFACFCLMFFGRGTVLYQFGLVMLMGVLIGTYSSIFIASPAFVYLREKYGHRVLAAEDQARPGKKKSPSTSEPRART